MSQLNRIHLLLTLQSIVIIFASINRLGEYTTSYVAPNEFLRWVDLNNMLVVPAISVLLYYLLKRVLENGAGNWLLGSGFVLGVYLLGAGYGDHEVTNYLHTRFCETDSTRLCEIIIFNDDEFSHWVFFGGFLLINTMILLIQAVSPFEEQLSRWDLAGLIGNSLLIALGIFANLGFEEIGADLYMVVAVAVLAVWLLYRFGPKPLLVYYANAYVLGMVLTVGYRWISGGS